jgi:enamine deaminase RidA (YjgF/YER057c/UK114 family)
MDVSQAILIKSGDFSSANKSIRPEIYKHQTFARVVTVSEPAKLVSSGQTPSDENYRCVAPDDSWAQYLHVINNLGIQLAAAGATWDDVVDKRTFTLDVDDAQQGHARSRNPGSVESRTPSTEHTPRSALRSLPCGLGFCRCRPRNTQCRERERWSCPKGPRMPQAPYRSAWNFSQKKPRSSPKRFGSTIRTSGISVEITFMAYHGAAGVVELILTSDGVRLSYCLRPDSCYERQRFRKRTRWRALEEPARNEE